jgi:hypothetical protein
MSQPKEGGNEPGHPHRRRRDRRRAKPRLRVEPTSPRWRKESGPKVCRKCGGRMYPADWIWQQYGLCLGWRCSQCKVKVMARSLPFKGLRKRKPDPDEVRDKAEGKGQPVEGKDQPQPSGGKEREKDEVKCGKPARDRHRATRRV